jgi:hypothetical protein
MKSMLLSIFFFIFYVSIHCAKSKSSHTPRNDIPVCSSALRSSSKIGLEQSYDIVVVGAGAAGSIVSAKLAAALDMKILVIEAGVETGNNDNINITDPALWLNVLHNDTLQWRFRSVVQAALNNRTIDLGFAKGTGGGAMHNAMGYVIGGQKWEVSPFIVSMLCDWESFSV